MSQKLGGVLIWGGELGPHLKHCGHGRGLPPRHLTVWPQYTNVTDRQDNGPIG